MGVGHDLFASRGFGVLSGPGPRCHRSFPLGYGACHDVSTEAGALSRTCRGSWSGFAHPVARCNSRDHNVPGGRLLWRPTRLFLVQREPRNDLLLLRGPPLRAPRESTMRSQWRRLLGEMARLCCVAFPHASMIVAVAVGTMTCARATATSPLDGADRGFQQMVLDELKGRNGVLVVFSPTMCNLSVRHFATLNRLAKRPGMVVLGVTMVDAPMGVDVAEYTSPFRIAFPVVFDHDRLWATAMAARNIEGPILAFVRNGRLQALLWSDAAVGTSGLPFAWDESAAGSAADGGSN